MQQSRTERGIEHVIKPKAMQMGRAALLAAWIFVVICGFAAVASYSNEPGKLGVPPAATAVGIESPRSGYLVVLAVHPKCSCTRATIAQLETLLEREPNIREVLVLISRPTGYFEDWATSDLAGVFQGLRNTRIEDDEGCRRAMALGMATSGSIVLYDHQGVARYWGGLTLGRGHVGDAPGMEAVRQIVRGTTDRVGHGEVYGCSLLSTSPRTHACPLCMEGSR